MLTFKVIAALLHYPDEALLAHGEDMRQVLAREKLLRRAEYDAVADFIARLCEQELLDAQSAYVDTFDRGRARSLYLFEHVHGESRDRGQAMIELLQTYRRAGFEIAVPELPDYIPLFLEFLSTQTPAQAQDWLAATGQLMQLLHARLATRGSDYAALFAPLVRLAGLDPEAADIHHQAGAETPDDTPQALDQVWQETPVTFGGPDDTCTSVHKSSDEAQPVHWHAAQTR
ncbi:nitrate reductase molybdenum cofactor assembly chaperone [Acidihalobacter yilgarnensis]|uniref:Nitrate reductase molybdenum cofactor assembly chaperone n=1 Tax=Acidihalobacter yilgarnensis TaxID=2819280 RepID=A0A1D8ILV1_9GAMM|nr:nitrate reductase molybdenum cofactor assembly chaperone [Acidihalobacter yilgarnensis]AOU97430.1 nitrate reductase molybdenum cofactor assembly chaperone [Acidihalobacter yilgarnensis]